MSKFRDFFNESKQKVGDKIGGGVYIGKFKGKDLIISEKDAPKEMTGKDAINYCKNL